MHTHSAGDITSGFLVHTVFDAYGNLLYHNRVGTNLDQVAPGIHTHDFSDITGTIPPHIFDAYDNLALNDKIGTNANQVASGNHVHIEYENMFVAIASNYSDLAQALVDEITRAQLAESALSTAISGWAETNALAISEMSGRVMGLESATGLWNTVTSRVFQSQYDNDIGIINSNAAIMSGSLVMHGMRLGVLEGMTNLSDYNNDAGYITNAGVTALNSLTGDITFEDGTNTKVRIDGQTIYIDSEGGGSGGITNFGITDKDAYRGDWADAISNVVSDTIVRESGVTAIAAGAYHFLALKKGKAIVWGENNWGQTNIPESLNSNVTAIACGNYHSLAIKDGEVISWGNNNNGQTNVPLEAQSGVTAIAGGYFHSLALKDGGVIAWGHNNKGQTTIPDTATNGVTAISAGYYFSLALKDGGVIAWGDNQYGQTDVPVEAQSGVTDISGGSYHSLALKNGKVISWGENATNVPLEAQSGVTAIAAGFSHSTAIKNGEIIKWDMDGNIVPNSITNNTISIDFKDFNIIALNESGTVEIDGPDSDSVPPELTMPSYSYTLDLHGGSAHIGGDKIDGYGISDTTAYRGDLGHALSNRLDAIDASGFITLDEVRDAYPLMTNKTAVQIGSEASAASGGGVAVGRNTVAGPSAVAIGDGAQATGTSVAIGWGVNNEEANTTMLNGTLNMADYGIKNLASLSLTNGSVIQGYGTSSTTAYRGDCGNAVSNLAQGALPKSGGTMTGNIQMGGNNILGIGKSVSSNASYVVVRLTNDLSIAVTTSVYIAFNDIIHDNLGEWSGSTFTAKNAGVYLVNLAILWKNTEAINRFILTFWVGVLHGI